MTNPARRGDTGAAMTDQPDQPDKLALTALGSEGSHRATVFMIIGVVALIAAIVKPWGSTGDNANPNPRPAATFRPAPSMPRPSSDLIELPYDVGIEQCFVGAAWRVFTVEQNSGERMRSWIGIEPRASAERPPVAAIPAIRLLTEHLDGMGFCTAFRIEPAVVSVEAWRVDGAGDWAPLELRRLESVQAPDAAIGAVFAPPSDEPDASAGWSRGRYVFSVREESGPARWFAVDVDVVPSLGERPPSSPGTLTPSP
jgi:hypothetical protein